MTTHSKATKPVDEKRASVTPEARQHMIAEAAYYKAEERSFAPGAETTDWLKAEQDIARMLEQRCCERKQVDIQVTLSMGEEPVAEGKLRNFNCHGLFVATNASFDKDTYLRVAFSLPSQANIYRAWGRVVHGAHGGLGFYVDVLESSARAAMGALSDHAGVMLRHIP
jgi:hypothetical protein